MKFTKCFPFFFTLFSKSLVNLIYLHHLSNMTETDIGRDRLLPHNFTDVSAPTVILGNPV